MLDFVVGDDFPGNDHYIITISQNLTKLWSCDLFCVIKGSGTDVPDNVEPYRCPAGQCV